MCDFQLVHMIKAVTYYIKTAEVHTACFNNASENRQSIYATDPYVVFVF